MNRRLNVAHGGEMVERNRLVGEQAGREAGQRGVLRTADPNGSTQRNPAANHESVHLETFSLLARMPTRKRLSNVI